MKSEAEIIGGATLRILRSSPPRLLCRKSLMIEVAKEFSELYELDMHVEDSMAYEAVLWLLINSSDYPYNIPKENPFLNSPY
ncbi:hypothetical protein SAMN05216563_1296 [Phytobacter palmae]|nr:hypothetical protein SAMN05216563_1296 [Phytobacter palmae]